MIEAAKQVVQQVGTVFVGKEETVFWMLAAILANGHILLEDIPGVGKTTLALAFSQVLGLQFGRVQFTPDVMPSDVVGYSVLQEGKLCYQAGAVMCNLFLADELNRAASRTQSALLEAMEEGQVTVDGKSRRLPKPFIVIATQNPTGGVGTQPLPDSQMDRFALRLSLGYPKAEDEKRLVLRQKTGMLQQVWGAEDLLRMQKEAADTYVCEAVAEYGVRLMTATRRNLWILRGGSPRGTCVMMAVAKAAAYLQGRGYVIPEDVQQAFLRTVPHRLQARGDGQRILHRIAARVRQPKL